MFSCTAAKALWNFVIVALTSDWEAQNLAGFLQMQAVQTGRKKRLFWLVFAASAWTLWTTRNKMLSERVFLR